MTVWDTAISEAISQADLQVNDRLAVELLKLGPVPMECFSEWVPPEPFMTALKSQTLPLRYRIQIIERLAKEEQQKPRLTAVESPVAPVSVLETLVGDIDVAVRLTAQHHPNCPAALLKRVMSQQQVAADLSTDAEQLAQLGKSQWGWIRQTVAQNPATPEDTLLALAAEPIDFIREAIAHNPSATAPVLAQLLAQPTEEIKTIIGIAAAHPNASDKLLKEIAQNKQYIPIILRRESLSESMFSFLLEQMAAQDDTPLWKEDARMRRSERGQFARMLKQNPSTPKWIIDRLADFDISDIRALVETEHENVESSQIERWTQEKFDDCLQGLASHPNASSDLLSAIAQKTDSIDVQAALAYNEKAPEDLRLQAFDKLLIGSGDRFVNKMAANPKTPISILQKIAGQCTGSEPGLEIIQTILNGQATPHLLSEIQSFFARHSDSSQQILFWLRQDEAFKRPIVQDWAEVRSRLNAEEQQMLDILSQMYLPAVGRGGRFPSRDAWVVNDPNALNLYGFLMLFNNKGTSRVTQRNWYDLLTLLGNPSLPAESRESLTEHALELAGEEAGKVKEIHLSLAFNSSVPEPERTRYFWSLLDGYSRDIWRKLAESVETPIPILLKLIEDSEKRSIVWQSAAKNPNTPLKYLEELAKDSNSTTVSYVLNNPGTPVSLLHRILDGKEVPRCYAWEAQQYGEAKKARDYLGENAYYQRQITIQEISRSQAAERILLNRENNPYAIALALKSDNKHVKTLAARNHRMPSTVIDAIAQDNDPNIRRMAVGHPNLSETCLLALAQDEDDKVQLSVAQSRQPLSDEMLENLMESGTTHVLAALSRRDDLPEYCLDKLASYDHRDVKTTALSNPNAPAQALWRELPKITNEKTIEQILRGKNNQRDANLNMPPALLERYSKSENRTIRFLVARYSNATVETLERLAFDEYELVRETAAANPSMPCDVLIRMAKKAKVATNVGSYHTVASQICRRKDAPAEALDSIVRQSTSSIRQSAVANANMSDETLSWLAENETDTHVLKGIVQHPNVTEETLALLAESESEDVRGAIAALPNCPPQLLLLELLTQNPSVEVCTNIAANPNTPESSRALFITSEKTALRAAIASNPSLSVEQLTHLSTDSSVEVQRAVANNPSTPKALKQSLKTLLAKAKTTKAKKGADKPLSPTLDSLPRLFDSNNETLPELLADYYESKNDFVRFVVLLNPQTPTEVLQKGARSTLWLERYAVAENSAAPPSLRQQLIQDKHELVANAAQTISA